MNDKELKQLEDMIDSKINKALVSLLMQKNNEPSPFPEFQPVKVDDIPPTKSQSPVSKTDTVVNVKMHDTIKKAIQNLSEISSEDDGRDTIFKKIEDISNDLTHCLKEVDNE